MSIFTSENCSHHESDLNRNKGRQFRTEKFVFWRKNVRGNHNIF